MEKSEKNFLEKIADAIPGIKGYRAKEERRDTDKRLRVYLADQLDEARRSLTDAKLTLTKAGRLDLLDSVDRTERRIQKASNAIRNASYGYSGFFDQMKVREAELDRLYSHDTSLAGLVDEVHSRASAVSGDDDAKETIQALDQAVATLDGLWQERKAIFDKPGEE